MARGRLGCPGCFPSQPAGSPGLGGGIQLGRLQSPPLEPFAAAAGEGPTASSLVVTLNTASRRIGWSFSSWQAGSAKFM